MQTRIEQFLQSLQARNLSGNTVRAYRADLKDFQIFLGFESAPEQVTRKRLREYLCRLNAMKLCRSSIARKFAAVKSLLRWLADEGAIPENVAAALKAPRMPASLPSYPSEEEMTKLLDGDLLTVFPLRDRLILELLYDTGVRVDELAGMNLDDFRDDSILVRGKGKKERFVIFGERAQDALAAYLPVRAERLAKQDRQSNALLIGLRNGHHERLTVRDIGRIVKNVARAKGQPVRHPHAYRHAFATHLLDHGVSIVIVSKLLGHAKLSTTEQYTHVSTARMLRAYNQAHPHAISRREA